MGEVILQWFYIVLTAGGLTGELPGDPEPNWHSSTQSQSQEQEQEEEQTPFEASTERSKRVGSFEGDIYNGF